MAVLADAKVKAKPKRSTLKERWGWYMYDFGNSGYAAVVLVAVYSAYFKNGVVGDQMISLFGRDVGGTYLWGLAVSIAMSIVAVISPVLGALADFSGAKKKFLSGFTSTAIIFCGTLFFVMRGDILMGMILFIIAEVGYRSAQVFYNALLPEIADEDDAGRISGNGWAVGQIGGMVCLGIILVPIIMTSGKESNNFFVRGSFLFTALFFALTTLLAFLWVKERAQPQPLPEGKNYFGVAFGRLWETFKEARRYREFIKYMLAFLVYNGGLIMMLDFAAIMGTVFFDLNQQGLIIFTMVASLTGAPGAYLFGEMADRISGKWSMFIALVAMIGSVIWLFLVPSGPENQIYFFIIGGAAGFALAAAQSVSRTLVTTFSPPGKSAEFYGLFAIVGHISLFISPFAFGWVANRSIKQYLDNPERFFIPGETPEQIGHRIAILLIIAFLVVGMLLLLFVNEKKGRELALAGEEGTAAEVA